MLAKSKKHDLIAVKSWLHSIGLTVNLGNSLTTDAKDSSFLDDVWIKEGEIHIVPNTNAGNLLHEAGHIATTPSILRHLLNDSLEIDLFDFEEAIAPYHFEHPAYKAAMEISEQMAIAWSFAAAWKIGINTFIPFENGFENENGESDALNTWKALKSSINQSKNYNCYVGVNSLVRVGMLKSCKDYPELNLWVQI